MSVFPLEFRSSGIVFGVIFASSGESADKDVFEFVSSHESVRVEEAELGNPALEHVISEDVQLTLFWLILEDVY